MNQPRIVISTLGTLGDVIPFVALGKALREAGHGVVLLSNENHRTFVETHGFEFIPVCEPEDPDSGLDHDAFFTNQLMSSFYRVSDAIDGILERGGPTVAINRLGNLGALFACERRSIPFFSVLLQPDSIWEDGNPITPLMLRGINVFRKSKGLLALQALNVPEPNIAFVSLFPHWFGYPRSQSSKAGRCFGFPFLDTPSPAALPADVVTFIEHHGPPVVFTCGTNVRNVAKFQHIAKGLSEEAGLPVLFLSRFCDPVIEPDGSGFRQYSFLEHGQLFAHARAVVHNGGIGVTAQAMRAGAFQIIVPLVWDQPDNAARVEALGVGRVVRPGALSPQSLAAVCDEASSADPRTLMVVADAVRRTDAITDAATYIRRMIADASRN